MQFIILSVYRATASVGGDIAYTQNIANKNFGCYIEKENLLSSSQRENSPLKYIVFI